ncbi:MAG: hypothetical protein QOJ15_1946 [Bradyrhizobium sp.]|jgi:hypothetical protein|nr:hypothetical protein [Bradyrhizobium sp.]
MAMPREILKGRNRRLSLGVERRSVACYLSSIIVNRDPETFVGAASRLGLENQIVANEPQRFKIGCAAGLFLLLLKPVLFLGGIGAGGGSILRLGHN